MELTDRGDEAAAVVSALDAVHRATVEGNHSTPRVEHGARQPSGSSRPRERAIGVASVTIARPSLDDVYLHHTGREFSCDDEGSAAR